MREVTASELLAMRELLQMESVGLAKIQALESMIDDSQLRAAARTSIRAMQNRIRSLQQFIEDNHLIHSREVF